MQSSSQLVTSRTREGALRDQTKCDEQLSQEVVEHSRSREKHSTTSINLIKVHKQQIKTTSDINVYDFLDRNLVRVENKNFLLTGAEMKVTPPGNWVCQREA